MWPEFMADADVGFPIFRVIAEQWFGYRIRPDGASTRPTRTSRPGCGTGIRETSSGSSQRHSSVRSRCRSDSITTRHFRRQPRPGAGRSTLFFKCQQPFFEGWVTWQCHSVNRRAAGQVTVIFATPGHNHPVSDHPVPIDSNHDGIDDFVPTLRSDGEFLKEPDLGAGSRPVGKPHQGVWVITHTDHKRLNVFDTSVPSGYLEWGPPNITSVDRAWSPYYDKGSCIFVMAQNVRPGRFDKSFTQRVDPPANDPERQRTRLTNGDLLLTIVGANTGDLCQIDFEPIDHFVCQSVALLRPWNASVGSLAALFLSSPIGRHAQMEGMIYGAGRPHLNFEQIRSLAVPVAPDREVFEIKNRMRNAGQMLSGSDLSGIDIADLPNPFLRPPSAVSWPHERTNSRLQSLELRARPARPRHSYGDYVEPDQLPAVPQDGPRAHGVPRRAVDHSCEVASGKSCAASPATSWSCSTATLETSPRKRASSAPFSEGQNKSPTPPSSSASSRSSTPKPGSASASTSRGRSTRACWSATPPR